MASKYLFLQITISSLSIKALFRTLFVYWKFNPFNTRYKFVWSKSGKSSFWWTATRIFCKVGISLLCQKECTMSAGSTSYHLVVSIVSVLASTIMGLVHSGTFRPSVLFWPLSLLRLRTSKCAFPCQEVCDCIGNAGEECYHMLPGYSHLRYPYL